MDRNSKPANPASGDRRKWRRYEVNWPFHIEGVDRDGHAFWTNGTLHDISARGSSGYCLDPPETGTRVVVSIKVPFKGNKWIRYLAEIVRLEEYQPAAFIALRFESTRPVFYTQDAGNQATLNRLETNTMQSILRTIVMV